MLCAFDECKFHIDEEIYMITQKLPYRIIYTSSFPIVVLFQVAIFISTIKPSYGCYPKYFSTPVLVTPIADDNTLPLDTELIFEASIDFIERDADSIGFILMRVRLIHQFS